MFGVLTHNTTKYEGDMTTKKKDSINLFAYPEVKKLFSEFMPALLSESDRGAVLVATDIVDMYLQEVFEKLSPPDMGNEKLEKLLKYPGPPASLSAKADIALAVRFISKNTYHSINMLRKIRNEVAHSKSSFSLKEQNDRLREMYNLGPNVPSAINRTAMEFLIHNAVKNVLNMREDFKEKIGKMPFDTPNDVIDYLSENPGLQKQLEEQLPKYKLIIGIALICGMIIFEREKAQKLFQKQKTPNE